MIFGYFETERAQPVVLSARLCLQLASVRPDLLRMLFQNSEVPRFLDEDLQRGMEIKWNDPPPTFLPRKTDLVEGALTQGEDLDFRSGPFRAERSQCWRAVLEWKNGRVLAGAVAGSAVSIFNFDLCTGGIGMGEFQKQKALFLLSVMCESMSGVHCNIVK
jgi:hypothetical protein